MNYLLTESTGLVISVGSMVALILCVYNLFRHQKQDREGEMEYRKDLAVQNANIASTIDAVNSKLTSAIDGINVNMDNHTKVLDNLTERLNKNIVSVKVLESQVSTIRKG